MLLTHLGNCFNSFCNHNNVQSNIIKSETEKNWYNNQDTTRDQSHKKTSQTGNTLVKKAPKLAKQEKQPVNKVTKPFKQET